VVKLVQNDINPFWAASIRHGMPSGHQVADVVARVKEQYFARMCQPDLTGASTPSSEA